MKTSREVLLARHQAAEPKLDILREHALATLTGSTEEKRSVLHCLLDSCRNCFSVPRFAWHGLAAAWLIIIALNFAARDSTPEQRMTLAQNRPAETLQALREQKRLLAELTGLVEMPDGEMPRFIPRPRSERRRELIMV